jgi:hypothetical protein
MAATNKSLAQNNKSRTGLRRPTSDRQRGAIPLALPTGGVPVAGSQRCWSFTALRDRRKLNMSWHHSDLYFFLCLLTGLATFLAITYECNPEIQAETVGCRAASLDREGGQSAIAADVPE